MPLITIPNVSESRPAKVSTLVDAVEGRGARVLDMHVDDEHGRSVLTCTGKTTELVAAMTSLAIVSAASVDLREQKGAHPRVGALDVCPFIPHDLEMSSAIGAARDTARGIGAAGIPVFLYGAAVVPPRTLPEIRSGGLAGLMERIASGWAPDEGPVTIDPSTGVVCVGARGTLIAFNVWIDGDVESARRIARELRTNLPGVRALGLPVSSHGRAQISMNLVAPEDTGIDAVFEKIETLAAEARCRPVATEIVGLVPEQHMPSPDATAARLLIEPGRSLETALLI